MSDVNAIAERIAAKMDTERLSRKHAELNSQLNACGAEYNDYAILNAEEKQQLIDILLRKP